MNILYRGNLFSMPEFMALMALHTRELPPNSPIQRGYLNADHIYHCLNVMFDAHNDWFNGYYTGGDYNTQLHQTWENANMQHMQMLAAHYL